nr:MAG TPA: hypothetical protein [Caudoviricetes sp.]
MALPVAETCSWCGHPVHAGDCHREIQVGSGKRGRVMRPCPCRRHIFEQQKKETPYHG